MGECDTEKIRNLIRPIQAEYDSPIRIIQQYTDSMIETIKNETDDAIYRAVLKVGIDVDRDKLLAILHQDRYRYEEAYRRGYKAAQDDIIRCKDCAAKRDGKLIDSDWCGRTGKRIMDEGYCWEAIRRVDD